jgi:hypothetical protein
VLEQEHGLKTSHKTVHGFFKRVVSRDKLPLGWAEPEQPLHPPPATDVDAKKEPIPDQSPDEFEQLLENLPKSPTLIVDFPGNKTSKILEFAAHFQMLKSFRASGIRPTLLIFTADDSTAKDSALETLEFFGDGADYLLIENSARFKSDSFKATPLYDEFVARNSPTLVVPRISAGTLNAWEAAQHRLGEYLSLDKICKADGLNVTSVLELSGVRTVSLSGARIAPLTLSRI